MRKRISIVVCMSMACMVSSNALDKIANLDGATKTNSVEDADNDKQKKDATKNVNNKLEQKNELKSSSSQEPKDDKEKKMQEQKEKENVVTHNQDVSEAHVQQEDDSGESNVQVEITPVLVVEDEEVEQQKAQSPSAQNTADVTNKTNSGNKVEKKIITQDGTNTDKGMLHKAKDSVMNATQGVMTFAQQKCGKVSASLEHAKNSTKDMTGWAKFSNFVKAWWEHFQK